MVSHLLDKVHAKAVEYQHPLHTGEKKRHQCQSAMEMYILYHTVGFSHGVKSSQIQLKMKDKAYIGYVVSNATMHVYRIVC